MPPDSRTGLALLGGAALALTLAAATAFFAPPPSPADPYAWASRADALLRPGHPAEALQALRRSLATGRYERPLSVDRLPLLAATVPMQDEALRAETLYHLQRAWDHDRPRLLALLPPKDHWPLYRRALAHRPKDLTAAAHEAGIGE